MALPKIVTPTVPFTSADRRIVFLLGIVAFVAGYGGAQMAHTLPYARIGLGVDGNTMRLLFTGVRALSLVAVVVSMLADRRGRREPLIAAFGVLVLGSLLTAFVPVTAVYVASQTLVRIAVVATASVGMVLLAEALTPAVRGYGMGLYGLAGSLGVGTGLLLLPIAERTGGGWRILFALTGLGLLVLPLLIRFLPESRAYRPGKPISFLAALKMGIGRHFWPLAGASFFVAAFSSPAFDFVLDRLINDLGWEPNAARFLLIASSGAGALGLLVGGHLADRKGRRPTAVIALGLGLVGGLGFYFLASGWLISAAIFLATTGATMLIPAFGAMRAELFPTRVRATSAGWVTNAAIVGGVAGFFLGGMLIERIGLPLTVAALSIGLVVAALLILRLPETKGMDLVRVRRSAARTTTTG